MDSLLERLVLETTMQHLRRGYFTSYGQNRSIPRRDPWELAAIVLTTAEGTEWFVIVPSLLLLIALPIYLLGMLFVDSPSQQTLTRLVRLR